MKPGNHDAFAVHFLAERYFANSALWALPTTKTKRLLWSLPIASFGHQDDLAVGGACEFHRDEHAGYEAPSSLAKRARARMVPVPVSDLVVEAFDRASVENGPYHPARSARPDLLFLRRGRRVRAHILEIGRLVDVEIGINAIIGKRMVVSSGAVGEVCTRLPIWISARPTRPEIGAFT